MIVIKGTIARDNDTSVSFYTQGYGSCFVIRVAPVTAVIKLEGCIVI